MTLATWILGVVAAALALALVLAIADALVVEWQIRREEREKKRRLAYEPKHYLNEDLDTRELSVAGVQAAIEAVRAEQVIA